MMLMYWGSWWNPIQFPVIGRYNVDFAGVVSVVGGHGRVFLVQEALMFRASFVALLPAFIASVLIFLNVRNTQDFNLSKL